MNQSDFIDRPPRIQPELPIEKRRIPAPPQKPDNGLMQILQALAPMVTIVGFLMVGIFSSSGRSPLMIIPMALAGVATTAFGIYTYIDEKRKQAAAERAYAQRLVEMSREMHSFHDLQRRFYLYSYPPGETTFRLADDARYEQEKGGRSLRTESRLWERRTGDDDFGVVRLGMGTLPSSVLYELENLENYDDPLARAALKLQEDSRFVGDIPVIISLRPGTQEESAPVAAQEKSQAAQAEESRRTPATHALGIAGEREPVYRFVRALLGHFVVFHPAADARLYVLANSEREWTWTQDVPHCRGDDNSRYTHFLDPRARADGGEEETPLRRFLEELRRMLAQRKLQLSETEENEQREDPTQPFCLMVVDLLESAYNQQSPLYSLETEPAFTILLAEGAMLGVSVIFLVPERSKVPGGCQSVIEVAHSSPATNSKRGEFQRLHFRYTETGLNTFRYVGTADEISTRDEMSTMARKLARLQVRETSGSKLATTVPFMTMMGYSGMAMLLEEARQQWGRHGEPQYADWLRVPVGLLSGRKVRRLVFSAKRDGVHGMVAGSTGSGKSELLISLITAMAITYDPMTLNFVLVDYKGGGAFKEFAALPHCVDIITNLAGEGVTRMFTAINAELRRRQKLNADTGTKNIVDYRQKGLHLKEPYPFLFIIIDEFAEMIADRAEYRVELETITRVGRAQGVSLLLAAQRPSGVTDQMRSNIKFRVCLRVETAGESREMLRRPDAAYLPGSIPGRGYLQVGNDEIELIQLAYSGDKYIDPTAAPRATVLWPDRHDHYNPDADRDPPELYKVIIETLGGLARERSIGRQGAPWPDFLPARFALTTVLLSDREEPASLTAERYLDGAEITRLLFGRPREPILTLNPWLQNWVDEHSGWAESPDWQRFAARPIVGLVDNPYAAKQLPMVIDLPRGHAVMFGASGWGKTMFVRTLALSLAASHSPGHLHLYLLDLGGRNLGILEKLPHVGAVINTDEEGYKERVQQLLQQLEEIIDERKTLLSANGLGDMIQYNTHHPSSALPAIVVAIDNFTEFVETFGGGPDNVESTLDRFIALARECKPFGIYLVITASQPGVLTTQLSNLFTERFTLKLADAADYRAVTGTAVYDLADIPGRGYTRVGRQALTFQVALPLEPHHGDSEEPQNENEELIGLAARMHTWIAQSGQAYRLPVQIGALPRGVLFKHLLARRDGLALEGDVVAQLKQYARVQWAESLDPRHADWLKVAFALTPGERIRELRLEAKMDGVHGLVAGGTGSGKSELLMTLIVGLALRYDPSILNFVLVDYKGGGAFKPFEDLPHCVDSISNLKPAAVRRMFTSINAEMKRRQRLNTETETKDIVEYRARGFHLSREPYPHLFIIIDEYAEMISESPEFKAELESITRVGRAQGVNLLLAAQRPTGVTDQMRANIKFRVCLRVEEAETSREMLRRSDAAFLPNGLPGRGYLQVGNESVELIQVAYTGENHAYEPLQREDSRVPKFYEVVVALTQEMAQGVRPRTPWPPFLPTAITLTDDPGPSYLAPDSLPLFTSGQPEAAALNPFLRHWLDGGGAWHGVDWNREAMRAVAGLVDDPFGARRQPLIVDLSRGHAVLFGASGQGKTTFLRALILSLAATHSPDEFHAHLLDLGGRNLEALGALPHVGTIITPDESGYEERVQQVLRELNNTIDRRKRLLSESGSATILEYNAANRAGAEPAILIAIDNFSEYLETFGNARENDPNNLLEALVAVTRQGRAYGIHVVITASRLNVLNAKLYSLFTERLALRLADSDDYSGIVGARVPDSEEIVGRGYTRVGRIPLAFQVALTPDTIGEDGQIRGEAAKIRLIGDHMWAAVRNAPHRYREPFRITALPKSLSHRQIIANEFKVATDKPFIGDLLREMRSKWDANGSAEGAEWLHATLGVAAGSQNRTLQLEAKYDGVHGMIAGGTGSGKSEILMTLIVSLAMNYSPDILNFVLVDYKGGGAFKPFAGLPHCVDIVTNLNKAAVNRMFTSINAEIRRRQKMNADTATKDIVEYRKKGLHLNGGEPYPHLFIIIDEYAEMIDDNEAYKAELESITRVGRAQGINLLLASQRPKGVTDQMRANIKLRLCLRVEQTDTSIELLRRPDAAFLPNGIPGRGYLQIGNENLELIQVSYTGEVQRDDREAALLWPGREPLPEAGPSEEPPKLYDTVVALANELVAGRKIRKPWPAFLPDAISLQTVIEDSQAQSEWVPCPAVTEWLNQEAEGWPGMAWRDEAMRATVGVVDDATEARQFPLTLNLHREHIVVFGDTGWGKSSFLRTILVTLTATHAPDELHTYVLDLGGRNYRALEALPHMGAVIYADDATFEERLNRLLEKLNRLADDRAQRLSSAGDSTLYEYNARLAESPRVGESILPAVLVLIDNFGPLQETQELLVEALLMPLLRRCLPAGISFVVSANGPATMPGRIGALFGQRLTFRQNNPERYLDIVGRGAIEIDEIPGRGYIRLGRRPLLLQAALPVGLFSGEGARDTRNEADELTLLARTMNVAAARHGAEWHHRPDPIAVLPKEVSLAALLDEVPLPVDGVCEAVPGRIGDLTPAQLNLKRIAPHCIVVGPPLSGRSTLLYSWLLSLASRHAPDQAGMILVDLQGKFVSYGGARSLSDLPHVLASVTEPEQLEEVVARLRAEGEAMAAGVTAREIFIFMDNFDDTIEEIESNRALAGDFTALARRYGRAGMHFIIATAISGGSGSELKRRIQASNFGIGLRVPQALDALGVMRVPPGFRNRELPVGRGFIVHNGQTVMIQAASPYDLPEGPLITERLTTEQRNARALDHWIIEIEARYPGQHGGWSGPAPHGAASPARVSAEGSALVQRLARLLQHLTLQATARLHSENDATLLSTVAATQQSILAGDGVAMFSHLQEIWRDQKRRMHLPESIIESLLQVTAGDEASLLAMLENDLLIDEPTHSNGSKTH